MLHEVTVHHTVCTTASTVSPTCVQKSQIPWFQQMWKSYIVQKAYCMYLIIKDIKERMTYRFFIHLFHLTLCSPLLLGSHQNYQDLPNRPENYLAKMDWIIHRIHNKSHLRMDFLKTIQFMFLNIKRPWWRIFNLQDLTESNNNNEK